MSLFRRHNRIRGIRIWKWGTFQIEVWFVPAGEKIGAHVHHHVDSNIVLLFGRMLGTIAGHTGFPTRFKKYPVPRDTVHAATAFSFCVFMNCERWDGNVTSAAEDFTAV